MTRDKMPTLVIAGAIVVGAMILAGVPLASLLFPLVVLACPLMMIFMMRGMNHDGGQGGHGGGCHGGHAGHEGTGEHESHPQEPSTRPFGKDNVR